MGYAGMKLGTSVWNKDLEQTDAPVFTGAVKSFVRSICRPVHTPNSNFFSGACLILRHINGTAETPSTK